VSVISAIADRLHPTATARAQQHVDREHPLHQLWPPSSTGGAAPTIRAVRVALTSAAAFDATPEATLFALLIAFARERILDRDAELDAVDLARAGASRREAVAVDLAAL
jgi:hypothetical protein